MNRKIECRFFLCPRPEGFMSIFYTDILFFILFYERVKQIAVKIE